LTDIVIDASFAVDLVHNQLVAVPEALVTAAIWVPVHFEIECAAALTNLVRRGVHDLDTAHARLGEIRSLDYEVERDLDLLMPGALRLAAANITLYDALYVVLATERLTHLWTTDRRLATAGPSVVVDRIPEGT